MASENENTVKEILDDLIPAMEAVEAQSTAVLRFLKENGIASEEQLQPYLQQGADTSNVKWRAVRVRMERLLNSALEAAQNASEKKKSPPEPQAAEEKKPDQERTATAKSPTQDGASENEKDLIAATEEKTGSDKPPARPTDPKSEALSDEPEKKEAA
jgi:hypothetical protein